MSVITEVAKAVWGLRKQFFWFGLSFFLMWFVLKAPILEYLSWSSMVVGMMILIVTVEQTIAVVRNKRAGKR